MALIKTYTSLSESFLRKAPFFWALSNFLVCHLSRFACLQSSLPTLCCSSSETSPLLLPHTSSHLLVPCRYHSLCLTIPSHHSLPLLLSILQPSAKDTAHGVIRDSSCLGLWVPSEFSSFLPNWSSFHLDKFCLFHKTQPRHLLFFASAAASGQVKQTLAPQWITSSVRLWLLLLWNCGGNIYLYIWCPDQALILTSY